MFDIRPLERDDAAAAGGLLVDAYPHRAHEPAAWQRSLPREQSQRWVAFQPVSGEIVAYAALWRVDGQRFRFDVVVSPAHRRQGLGGQLVDLVKRQARMADAATLQARAYADATEALTFLTRRGFAETMRMRGFVLDLTKADVYVLSSSSEVAPGSGITIGEARGPRLADSGFWSALTELHDAAREGWPDPDPGGPNTPSDPAALRSLLIPFDGAPLAFFLASRGDHLVGYSLLTGRRASGHAQFAATAVHPGYRARRIGTALRARCLLGARDAGYSTVRSASGSSALIRINERFGFTEDYCEIGLVLRVARPLVDLDAALAPTYAQIKAKG